MNTKTYLLSLVVICTALLTGSSAHAGSAVGLRCGGYLISEGYHEALVKTLCGEPDSVSIYHRHVHTGPGSSDNHRDIEVTEFLYNFGPQKFMRVLRFEGGRLVSIESAGYGYR